MSNSCRRDVDISTESRQGSILNMEYFSLDQTSWVSDWAKSAFQYVLFLYWTSIFIW